MTARLYLLDTSFFIGQEHRRFADVELDGDAAVAVVTLAELHYGVLVAADASSRADRLLTLVRAQTFDALPIDVAVTERFAGLVAFSRERGRKLKVQDAWIAAIAAANGATILTQDGDFDDLPVDVVRI